MNIIFKKSSLPFLKGSLHDRKQGRNLWTLARMMQNEEGLQNQHPTELMLLQEGAYRGDVWSMCELARTCFEHGGDLLLPQALSWWKKAIERGDEGARWDVQNRPILARIRAYRGMESEYANIEMRCAMLAEYFLTDLGCVFWNSLSPAEQIRRLQRLVQAACPILRIPSVTVEGVYGLSIHGVVADGVADPCGKLFLRGEMLAEYERLIEVIFHELGHFVTFAMWNPSPATAGLQKLYGISDRRAEAWKTGAMGYEVPISEEDPDTLSYGVYTQWAILFAATKG